MSILTVEKELTLKQSPNSQTKLKPEAIFSVYQVSDYKPTEDENTVRKMIIKHFQLGDITMQKPRVEFNDMSVITRMMYDQMSFNTYQPNNGEGLDGDVLNSWRSNAIRPIVRNKAISIAAHATARLIFPKVFAYDKSDNEQRDAATVMQDLMEWAADKSDYSHVSLLRVLTALTDPASIGYTEYVETYREVKTEKKNGKWQTKKILDDTLSGFKDYVVPCNELYIENPFEPDIQKQGWLIWRKVISYSLAEAKYKHLDNFKHVFPGVQLIYNDANQSFYQVYDANLRQDEVEEVNYWNRTLDLKITMVNGVMLTDFDNPNPRLDKKYPFDKFYYEMITPKFFYGKSLAFKLQPDARIINDAYQMFADGSYLAMMPPLINAGGESITSDVIIPGLTTTLEDPNSSIKPIQIGADLRAGANLIGLVEKSLGESAVEPINSQQQAGANTTAYEISRLEQNANTILGLFLKMIAQHVKDFGRLRISDILQYLTIADVSKLEGNPELVYRTFMLSDKNSNGATKTRKIKFDSSLPNELDEEGILAESNKVKEEEWKGDNVEIYKVNPTLYRDLIFETSVTPDVLNPKSSDLEKAYGLEEYDRMIQHPEMYNPEETSRLLLGLYDSTRKDPDKYLTKTNPETQMPQLPGLPPTMNPQALPAAGNAPLANMGKMPLPQTFNNKV